MTERIAGTGLIFLAAMALGLIYGLVGGLA